MYFKVILKYAKNSMSKRVLCTMDAHNTLFGAQHSTVQHNTIEKTQHSIKKTQQEIYEYQNTSIFAKKPLKFVFFFTAISKIYTAQYSTAQ